MSEIMYRFIRYNKIIGQKIFILVEKSSLNISNIELKCSGFILDLVMSLKSYRYPKFVVAAQIIKTSYSFSVTHPCTFDTAFDFLAGAELKSNTQKFNLAKISLEDWK